MKINTKISLIMRFQLTPDEVNFIDSLNLAVDYEKIMKKEEYQILSDSFSQVLEDEKLQEIDLLELAYINSKIKGLTITINPVYDGDSLDNDLEDKYDNYFEDPEFEEYNKEQEKRWKERMKLHKEAVAKYKKHTQEEFDGMLFNYVWNTYPQISNGFDRTIYSKAKHEFPGSLGFYNMYETPDVLRNKINIAQENVKGKIMGKIRDVEALKLYDWLGEYKKWLKEAGISKCTKSNIKEFFKEKDIKASESTMEKIKNLYINTNG